MMTNQCEICSAIRNIDWHFGCAQIKNSTIMCQIIFYSKIGRHKWPNDYMLDWLILCFGQKMAEGRPLFCTLLFASSNELLGSVRTYSDRVTILVLSK